EVAAAQSYKVLYSFQCGADGGNPVAGLIADSVGNLYSTTLFGGALGFGTVFKINSEGIETVLHSFGTGPEGLEPRAGLVRDNAGTLYGTASQGGNLACNGGTGCGAVFKLGPSGDVIVLHAFGLVPDGQIPFAGLVADQTGNLYGTTTQGGAFGFGT